jgi:competence protein ComEA
MERKKLLESYFTFSRKDRIGILFLMLLIVLVFFLPGLVPPQNSLTTNDTAWIAAVRKLEISQDSLEENDHPSLYQYDRSDNRITNPKVSLFYFDPNTLPAAGWKKLGLRDKTIQIILNYLEKGGRFRSPEDLKRIYGLPVKEYTRLLPFIKIEPVANPAYTTKPEYHKKFNLQTIDINTADTSLFIALPGIGSKLAARIVAFREKLGGFYSIEQIAEVYGLQDSVFQRIRHFFLLNDPLVKKININTASVDELKAHPYIKYNIANALVAYRNEHGPFSTTEEIKKVSAITMEVYAKIEKYLAVRVE